MMPIDALIALQDRWPPLVVLFPDDPWPQTPTGLVRQANRCPSWFETPRPERPTAPGALWLPGLGEAQVVEARLVDMPPDWGESFRGQYSVARAIARVDPAVRAVPVRDEWLLATAHAPPNPPVLLTCAFWLASRQRVYAGALADITEARERLPWVVALAGLGRPDGSPVQ